MFEGKAEVVSIYEGATTTAWNETAAHSPTARVLAVDDVEQNLRLLTALLAGLPCEVVRARSGEQALSLVKTEEFAVLLLDVNMPGMDGYAVARRVRELPQGRELPIVFITASDRSDQGVLRGYDSGAVDYLFKPVQREILRSKVSVFADLYERRRQLMQTRDDLHRSNVELRQLAAEKAELAREARVVAEDLQSAYMHLKSTQAQLVQSAKLATLGELVAGLAHEINNPLAFCLSHLDTARRGLVAVRDNPGATEATHDATWAKVDDRLLQLNVGLSRIADLMTKLQTFARHREGDFRVVSVRACLEAVVALVRHRLGDRVSVDLRVREPDLLGCFPTLLNEAVMSLVVNAIESMADAGTITIASTYRDGDCVISVTDTGGGIAAELRDRVLEPFFTTKQVGSGVGLGLPLALSIARRHGGTLELSPNVPHGTQARLVLPLTRSQSEVSQDPRHTPT